MTQFGITKHEGSGNFVVSFSQPQFHEFMSGLTSTPREEVFRVATGYDLTKSKLRNILERLRHQIDTQSTLISDQYTITCAFSDKHEVTWNSFEQFFGTSESASKDIVKLSVTATFMIGFNRQGEQKIERQVVSMEFQTRPTGWVRVRIMSTEITWPPTVFQLLEGEISSMSVGGEDDLKKEVPPFTWIIKGMLGARLSDRVYKHLGEYAPYALAWGRAKVGTFLLAISVQLIMLISVVKFVKDKPMYNPDTGLFERGTFPEYVERMGLDGAIAHAQKSFTLYDVGYAGWAPGHTAIDFVASSVSDFFSLWAILLGLFVAVVLLYCRRRVEKYLLNMSGRIFIDDGAMPVRERVERTTGLVEAILCGLFATALWVGASQFIQIFS